MTNPSKHNNLLQKALKLYQESDYATQQKARFIYYMIITAIVVMVFIISSSTYLQLIRIERERLFLPVLLIEFGVMIMFFVCLYILVKGFYGIATHLFVSQVIVGIWIIMWIDHGHYLSRLDTIVIIVAVLNMAPLFITKYKSTIWVYIFTNIAILIFYMWYWADLMHLPNSSAIDYVIDSTVAILFTGVLGYNIFNINEKALDIALNEIRERHRSEEKLKETELFRSRLFDSSKIAIVVMDIEKSTFIDCNFAAVDIFQFPSKESLLGKTPMDVSAPVQYDGTPSMQKALFYVEKVIKEGHITFEWLHKRSTGELWDAEIHMMSFVSGNHSFIQFSLIDITDKKKIENALRESEAKYRYLLENMNEVVMMVDNDDRVLFVNRKFTELLGYTPEEILGKIGYEVLIDPSDRQIIIEENKSRLEKKINQYELCFNAKDGSKIDFLINGAPIVDSEGVTMGSIGTMTDITERNKAERALKESEELNRKLIEAFPDVIMQSDLKGNILYANEPFEKLTGITPKDYFNPKRKAKIHPEDLKMISDAIKDLLSSEKTHTNVIENRLIDSWGKMHWFSGTIAKLQIKGKTILQTVTRDITEKKEIEQELEKHRNHLEILIKERTEELAATNEELTASNEELYEQKEELRASLNKLNETQKQLFHSEKMASVGILSAGIAHEINNPLNFINGGIYHIENYIKTEIPEHFDKLSKYIDVINIGINRASAIVTSLNHYSRQDDLPRIDCDIRQIIENCLIMLQNNIKDRIEIKKKYISASNIFGNDGKLHQAFLNILSNSEQSIDNKGFIEIKIVQQGNFVVVEISDSGCGIKAKNLQKVFDPFYTTKDPGKGTGLGLAITYNIIQEHNGAIELESVPGKGTKVVVKLPVTKLDS